MTVDSLDHFDAIIVGAGASGLMCAITAAKRGRRVLIVEHSKRLGIQILMSGGGRCNFTSLHIDPECYLSANPHFCKSALKRYTQWDFIDLVEKHGISYHERDHGQLFCDDSAREILSMLLAECDQAGVTIKNPCEVQEVLHNGTFHLDTDRGLLCADSLVIATGGLSIPTAGATGFGHDIARQFGMKVLPLHAGLVSFSFSGWLKDVSSRLSGIALKVTLSTGDKGFTENVLFTHRGLSGPAALQLSNYWRIGDSIFLDLFPGVDAAETLKSLKQSQPKGLLRNLLAQQLPKRLVRELESILWQPWADKPVGDLPDQVLIELARQLKNWELKPSGTEGYRTAEVTSGGVDTDEVSSKTMESKTQPGLYLVGEVLDVTGHLGGFNFQWAWSSGHAAGSYI
jgi:predicted Rossmann fold flavoprotein